MRASEAALPAATGPEARRRRHRLAAGAAAAHAEARRHLRGVRPQRRRARRPWQPGRASIHRDTRHLSHLYLTLDGHRPLLLSSTVRDDNAVLICDLTNPDCSMPTGRILLSQGSVPHPPHAVPVERAVASSAWRCTTTAPGPAAVRAAARFRRRLRRHLRGARRRAAPARRCCTRRCSSRTR